MKKEECIPGTRVYWDRTPDYTGTLVEDTPYDSVAKVRWDDDDGCVYSQSIEYLHMCDEFLAWVNQVRRERGVENADNNAD